jgi:hypothetical protein
MVSFTRNVSDPPILWSIPFSLLVATIVLAALDKLFPVIPLNVGPGTWMWAVSTLITTIMASLVAEMISDDSRRAMLSMVLSSVVFTLIYKDLSNIVRKSIVENVQGAIPNPLISMVIYTSILTVVPGALTGVIFGGVLGSFPIFTALKPINQFSIAPKEVIEPRLPGLEKVCGQCGYSSTLESRFCPYCGTELTMRRAPTVQYCRFCGSRINYLGQFCPDCGKAIDIVMKPRVLAPQ